MLETEKDKIIHQKLRNISAAIFYVTKDLPETDMLKMSLRKNSLECVSYNLSYRTILDHIRTISSELTIAKHSGIIAEMNTTLLLNELRKVEEILTQYITQDTHKLVIDPSLFNETLPKITKQIKPRIQAENPQGYVRKNERRDTILKLLGEKGNLTIKDFSTVIKDYSEKTIQRELLTLVDEGVVKKQGERRWSTYSLAQ